MLRAAVLVLALVQAACVGTISGDAGTGSVETRVYTPLDLLGDGEEDEE